MAKGTTPLPLGATPGLIGGYAFDAATGRARAVESCDEASDSFRWVHLSLAHQGSSKLSLDHKSRRQLCSV